MKTTIFTIAACIPLYNFDVESRGFSGNAKIFNDKIEKYGSLFISTPEDNLLCRECQGMQY